MKANRTLSFLLSALFAFPLFGMAQTAGTILHAPEAAKLLPDAVFFAGKTATTQLRNSAGIRLADNHYVLAVLVDTSGYSSAVQEKYQGCLLTEVPLTIDGHTLPSGAYGIGFLGAHFLVMDIGNHTLLQAPSTHDARMQHPMPLQILPGPATGAYRLCLGRECIDLSAK